MSRVYYLDNKLIGAPLSENDIRAEDFDYILQHGMLHANQWKLETPSIPRQSWRNFFGKHQPTYFLYLKADTVIDGIRKDRFYESHGFRVYIPDAILFTDAMDARFPSRFPNNFYFLAKVGENFELGQCLGGDGDQWHDLPQRNRPVEDKAVLAKIGNTMRLIRQQLEAEQLLEKQAVEAKRIREANRLELDPAEKDAYRQIIDICMPQSRKKGTVHKFIDRLKSYAGDEEYGSTFRYVMDFVDEKNIPLILSLDLKSGVDNLARRIRKALKDNFELAIPDLPKQQDYEEDTCCSDDNVIADFSHVLHVAGMRLTLINEDSDDLVFIIHPSGQSVESALQTVGVSVAEVQFANHMHKMSRPDLEPVKKAALSELAEICMPKNPNKHTVLQRISQLKNYDGDAIHLTTVNYLGQSLRDYGITFILEHGPGITLDRYFRWQVALSLWGNYRLKANIPSAQQYPDGTEAWDAQVLKDFALSLAPHGMMVTFIITGNDYNCSVIHARPDMQRVHALIRLLGHEPAVLYNR